MTFRIDRSSSENLITFALSGEIGADDAARLQGLLDGESDRRVVLDLRDVTLADRDAVGLLAHAEATGVSLVNCPEYIRSWIAAEHDGT